jgi:Protein of unknown function (DUF2950)
MIRSKKVQLTLVGAALAMIGGAALIHADDKETKIPPKSFDTKEDAAKALFAALDANDDAGLKALTGSDSDDLVQSGADPIVARERKKIANLAKEDLDFDEMKDDGSMILVIGDKEWPMPVPLAKTKDGKWFFDAEQGRDEVIGRRVGENELRVMDVMRQIAEAQDAYRAKDRDGDGVLEYAQKIVSGEGKKDGLYWPDPEDGSDEERSPFGAFIEELQPYLKDRVKGAPFSGYLFKLLTAQGPSAPDGAYSWMQGDNLSLGFGVLAVPAEYRKSGVKSFIISHRKRLLEKDLGKDGAEAVKSMTVFEPDMTWTRVGDP